MPTKPTPIRRTLALLKQRKGVVALLIVLIVISQGAALVVPFISKALIDALTNYITNHGPLPLNVLIYSALGILVATVVSSVLQSSYNYHLFKVVTKIEDQLRNAVFEKYLQLHALFHHGSSSGQIIGRIERGATAIYIILNDIIGQNLVPPLVIFVGSFGALLYENVWIGLAVLVPFPIYFLATKRYAERIYAIEQQANDAFDSVSKELYDVAGNVLTVKKFSQERAETENEDMLMRRARDIQYSAERLWGVIENVQGAIATVGRVTVLVLSAWFVLRGEATIGQFVLYVTLQTMAYQPLSQLSVLFLRMRRNATRVERMYDILDESVKVNDKPGAIALPPLHQKVELKNVSFSYRSDGQWALHDIDLTVAAGTTVALVGRSGSGKTTFANLHDALG